MICSFVNREGRIVRLLELRTLLKSRGASGSQVSDACRPESADGPQRALEV